MTEHRKLSGKLMSGSLSQKLHRIVGTTTGLTILVCALAIAGAVWGMFEARSSLRTESAATRRSSSVAR